MMMTRLKKLVKTIWKYKWEMLLVVLYIGSITESTITKDYDDVATTTWFTVLSVTVLFQHKVIKDQEGLIEIQDETIKIQDELISKKDNWIKKVKKIIKEN